MLLHVLSLTSSGVKSGIIEWAEANVVFPHSDRSQHFDSKFAPWWNKPLEDFASGDWRVISFLGPTGCGKTTFLEVLTSYIIAQDPGPTLIIGQSDDDISDWAEERLMNMLEQIHCVKALFPSKTYAKRKTEIMFPHMPLRLGGANINNLQSKSCRYVFLDEVWCFAAGMVKEAIARIHDRSNGVLLAIGQAGTKNDEMDLLFETCQKYDFNWRCPHCDQYNVYSDSAEQLVFDEVKDDRGQIDRMALARSVRIRCPLCSAEFIDNEYNRKLLSLSGKYLPTESNPRPGRIGYHMSALGIWWIPWYDIALERVESIERMRVGDMESMKRYKQKRCASPWSDEQEVPKIQLQSGGYGVGQYSNGELIEGELIRFLTVDRQKDHFWAIIRAWKADGSSKLLFADKLNDWSEIVDLEQKYKVNSFCVAIDSRYDPTSVQSFCAKHNYLSIQGDRALKWTHVIKDRPNIQKPYSPLQQVLTIEGTTCYHMSYSNLHIKDVLNLLRIGRLKPFEVPNDIRDEYGEQLASEIKKNIAHEGRPNQMMWLQIGNRPNHLWDCECMSVCLAIMMDCIRLNDEFEVIIE